MNRASFYLELEALAYTRSSEGPRFLLWAFTMVDGQSPRLVSQFDWLPATSYFLLVLSFSLGEPHSFFPLSCAFWAIHGVAQELFLDVLSTLEGTRKLCLVPWFDSEGVSCEVSPSIPPSYFLPPFYFHLGNMLKPRADNPTWFFFTATLFRRKLPKSRRCGEHGPCQFSDAHPHPTSETWYIESQGSGYFRTLIK